MPITDWPADQRPREKLLNQGPEALSDAELLAIFLRTGIVGTNAVELARQLLAQHGGLRPLLALDQPQFCQTRGLGAAKYVQLQAALEIGRRYLHARLQDRTALANPDDTRHYLKMQLRDRHKEVFSCLFLDNRHRVIAFEELFQGTIDGAAVHPREVVRVALRHNAAAVIAAHNHPSGVAEPSSADIAITRRLKEALDTVDIRLLDHFVIGDGNPVSLAERGLM